MRLGVFCFWLAVGLVLWWAGIQAFYVVRGVVVLFLVAHGGHSGAFFGR